MNARTYALTEHAVTDCFVLATQTDEHVRWLAGSLVSAGAVEPVSLDPHALVQRIGTLNPSLVFVDFGRADRRRERRGACGAYCVSGPANRCARFGA